MSFTKKQSGNVEVVTVNLQRATLKDANEFKLILQNILEQNKFNIVIDISLCEFIDSTFLGVLVSNLKKTKNEKGDLKLVGFKPNVRAMFELTNMFKIFDTFSNINLAINAFNS